MDRKPTSGSGGKPWYTSAYRRAVIDMHIPDWDDKFLSRVDVEQYVNMLVRAHAQSIVAYAMSHVGLFNYPTKVGRQHKGLKGRNLVREIIDACHGHGIAVQLYNSLVFDRTTADLHPDWRYAQLTARHMARGEGTAWSASTRLIVSTSGPGSRRNAASLILTASALT